MIRSRSLFNCVSHYKANRLSVSSRYLVRPLSSFVKMASEVVDSAPPSSADGNSIYIPRYVDIGINLADPIFRGIYHGKERHPNDLQAVISRAQEVGCQKLLITGSDFKSSRDALDIAKEYPGIVYTTAGVHPCSSAIFSSSHAHHDAQEFTMPNDADPEKPVSEDHEPDEAKTTKIISELRTFIESARSTHPGALVAFGEFGLDYDRLHYCSRKVQLHSFAAQLDLVLSLRPQPPLFLHSRAAHEDFVGLLKAKFGSRLEKLERGGVVHSFTGTAAEMHELADLGLYIGTNGCSFKTEENCTVVKEIPLDRLMLETDGPWCEIRPTHAGWRYLLDAKAKAEGIYAGLDVNGDDSAQATPESTPASTVVPTPRTATPNPQQEASAPAQAKPAKPPKKPKRKEPEVPERWRFVKKEKWVEGSMVKGRNEPCMIERVGQVVAGVRGEPLRDVCEAAWANTVKVFGLDEDGKA
ncbi:TatD family hydrolase [Xylaria bambusicola]|uniref:TatD family hydrolase n=1 Tax=Xylaria bambusicola TaxID=326684 RepID=UPI0020075BB6|nr:TatD family hydrolase [Xylaria bambusicola]KAI0518366.1 TatD family hydrolase [Xylaria bambusicola]